MTEPTKGVLAMIGACVIWGLSPLYWNALAQYDALDIIGHRTFWSAVTFGVFLALQGRLGEITAVFRRGRMVVTTTVAGALIAVNWLVFVWAVGNGRATEASLGYFLFPLVAVVLGRVLFSEQLNRFQWSAVALAASAVILMSLGLGTPPWVALILAISFGLYGVVKKELDLGPVLSVMIEVLILSPVAIYIILTGSTAPGVLLANPMDAAMLSLSGVFTATPLIMFAYAARRLKMATVGLLQYLNPTLQFFCATIVIGEMLRPLHMVVFPMIWVALALYSWAAWRQERARSRAVSSAGMS